jgi:hypothetical protein
MCSLTIYARSIDDPQGRCPLRVLLYSRKQEESMRNRNVLVCSVAAIILAFVLAGCGGAAKAAEESWTYVGTWANSSYNGSMSGSGGPPGKIVMTSSTMDLYDRDFDLTPLQSGAFATADDWTSGGDHYFKGIAVIGANSYFFLMRVANNNNTMESNSSSTSYPPSINPAGGQYGIFARQ